MVQSDITNDTIAQQVDSANSLTVPTGETWKVNLTAYQDSESHTGIIINGATIMRLYFAISSFPHQASLSTVLTDGDTISVNGNGVVWVSGFDVSAGSVTVDNTPVSEEILGGGSVSVPAGETWDVTAILSNPDNGNGSDQYLSINGTRFMNCYDGGNARMVHNATQLIVSDGDTISTSSDGNAHLGGWKI